MIHHNSKIEKSKLKVLIVLILVSLFLFLSTADIGAHPGCCSHHDGVDHYQCSHGGIGYHCGDGTPLSSTCDPYYAECDEYTYPQVTTNAAMSVTITSATLNGNLDSTGAPVTLEPEHSGDITCQIWFEYGKTTSYGYSTPEQSKSSADSFSASISGLDDDTTYHFRAVASSGVGTDYGLDMTFTTDTPTPTPPPPPGLITTCNGRTTSTNVTALYPTTSWQTVSGSLSSSTDTKRYAVSITTTGTYEFSLCSADGGGDNYDSYLCLFDAAGGFLTSNDDACDGTNAKITYSITSPGTYYIQVSGYSTNYGSYTMAYRRTPSTPPPGYCSCGGTIYNEEWISRVQFNTIDKSSGGDGYANYTSISTDVVRGRTYSLEVTISQIDSWSEYVKAYFDWNHDLDFEDSGEGIEMGHCSSDGCIVSANVNIPSDATLGSTRMRIVQQYYSYHGPCGSYTYGDTEDYTVNIIPEGDHRWIEKADTPNAGGYGEAVLGASSHIYIARCMYASSTPYFWRYNPTTNSWNSMDTSGLPTGAFRNGAALTGDYDDSIYALLGGRYSDSNRHLFYRYDITTNSWEQLTDTLHAQGAGDAITWSGYDNLIYALLGSRGHGTAFAYYDISTNSWNTLPFNPTWTVTDDGASLVWTGGEYLYALRGEYDEAVPNGDFARYHIPTETWEDMNPIPESEGVGDGGSLLWVNEYPDYIFALGGGSCLEAPGYNFYRYTISSNNWEQLESIPCPIGYYVGNRLGFANGHIYYWQGAPSTWDCGGDAFYMFY